MKKKKKFSVVHNLAKLVGTVFFIILIPILILNAILIIKGYINKDEAPQIAGYSPIVITTSSMEPKISSGDLIISKQTESDEIKAGNIISFYDPDSSAHAIVTHRVVEVVYDDGEVYYRTKGDASVKEDEILVPEKNLVGVYKYKVKRAGKAAKLMQSTPGLALSVTLPIILPIAYVMIMRRKNFETHNEKDTDTHLTDMKQLDPQEVLQYLNNKNTQPQYFKNPMSLEEPPQKRKEENTEKKINQNW